MKMDRRIVLSALLLCSLSSFLITANPPQSEKVVGVEQVAENLFVLKGGGGNSAAFITAEGVILVDTKIPGWGQPLINKIRELTPKPVTTLINTHTHSDHVGGNVDFSETVTVVAHEDTRRLMHEWNGITGFGPSGENIFETNNGRGIATRTFSDRMTLGNGADQVDLYYFGRGHTGGDAWVVFPSLRTMHSGDMFAGKELPLLDANNGGSGIEFSATLKNAYTTLTEVDTIITGHGSQMTREDLREFTKFVDDFVAAVRDSKEAGRSVDSAASAWKVPATYTSYPVQPPAWLKSNIEVVYNELP
jgi:glyoxylase-like metal-dependent hydrolase (beta-lactamase superfamily II)